jgi:hypothetical protein
LLASGAITQREFEDKAFGVEDALYEIQKKRDKGKLTQAEFEAKSREFARLNAENPANKKFNPTNKGNIRRWEAKRAEDKRKEEARRKASGDTGPTCGDAAMLLVCNIS